MGLGGHAGCPDVPFTHLISQKSPSLPPPELIKKLVIGTWQHCKELWMEASTCLLQCCGMGEEGGARCNPLHSECIEGWRGERKGEGSQLLSLSYCVVVVYSPVQFYLEVRFRETITIQNMQCVSIKFSLFRSKPVISQYKVRALLQQMPHKMMPH